jgi:hypothetical protein
MPSSRTFPADLQWPHPEERVDMAVFVRMRCRARGAYFGASSRISPDAACGCLYREQARNRTHGQSDTGDVGDMVGMRARCRDVGNKPMVGAVFGWILGGNRSSVSIDDMGERPPGMQIDGSIMMGRMRRGIVGGRLARRIRTIAGPIGYHVRWPHGQTVSQWADEIGLSRGVLDQRRSLRVGRLSVL